MDDEDTRQETNDRPSERDQESPEEWPLGLDAEEGSPEEEGYGYGV